MARLVQARPTPPDTPAFLTARRGRAYGRRVRTDRLAKAALAVALVAAIGVAGVVEAKPKIKPKAGGYAGTVTNSNGSGTVRLIYATFTIDGKSTKGVSLFEWTGALKCEDGTSRDAGGIVLAPLKGVKFSGRSTSGEQTVSLKGRFTANTKLTGTARLTTDGPTPARRCDTGRVTFKAKRK
jgi:hypothetical protein